MCMLRTDAKCDRLALDIILQQAGCLLLIQLNLYTAELDKEIVALALKLRVEEVHNGHADEPGDKEVCRMVEDFLRCSDLLDIPVAHDDDAIAQGHSFRLVVGNIHESRVNALAQLDDLGAHFVAELRVQVGQRLIHQHHLRGTDDRAADGDTLTLTA